MTKLDGIETLQLIRGEAEEVLTQERVKAERGATEERKNLK